MKLYELIIEDNLLPKDPKKALLVIKESRKSALEKAIDQMATSPLYNWNLEPLKN
ncbi:MAG TPA: hypothetical protein VMZ91_12015 [Candidatus Paceibacterota bacterium]|nr:hypothetical protein [Candidatus Paceibacterota bacterium]